MRSPSRGRTQERDVGLIAADPTGGPSKQVSMGEAHAEAEGCPRGQTEMRKGNYQKRHDLQVSCLQAAGP